jgi:hypothetical protein
MRLHAPVKYGAFILCGVGVKGGYEALRLRGGKGVVVVVVVVVGGGPSRHTAYCLLRLRVTYCDVYCLIVHIF